MAMILDAFVDKFDEMLLELIQEKAMRLLGVKEDLQRLHRRLENIKSVLVDAERKRHHESAIDAWIGQLKDVMYDADDIIDLCKIKGPQLLSGSASSAPSTSKKVHRCFSLFSFFTRLPLRNEIALGVKHINDRLHAISKDRSEFNLQHIRSEIHISKMNPRQTSELVDTDVMGCEIENATKELVELLVSRNQQQCVLVAISGMGGIGKTTLAQKILNEPRIQTRFSLKVWVCISQDFNEISLLKQIIRGTGESLGGADAKEELQYLLQNAVSGKEVLLVLDDVLEGQENVWNELLRNPMEDGASICRILVTTRDENVARKMEAMHIHRMNQLSNASGWELLCKIVFSNGEDEDIDNLKDIGMKIVDKCHGLPLAIKAISGILMKRDRVKKEWEQVLSNDAWSLSELPEELRGALYLSYENLPSHLKQCFLYLSLFPKNFIYVRWDLVRMWVAEGFVKTEGDLLLEDLAEEYYEELVRRNLLQREPDFLDGSRCKMHDLLRSLAKYLSRDEGFYVNPQGLNTTAPTRVRRLSIENSQDPAVISAVEVARKSLRTLFIFNGSMLQSSDLLVKLTHLRVLDLSASRIQNLPESLGNLVHLRLVDLDGTNISMIPESIGSLANLQILNLNNCNLLHTLPRGITRLCNLRRLGVRRTPLSYLPKGIGILKQLNDLDGFFVGENTTGKQTRDQGCSLEELGSLSQLRQLCIYKLERALTSASFTFNNNPHLKKLSMFCTPLDAGSSSDNNVPYSELESLFEQLSPPPCIEELKIFDYFGRGFPSWMMSNSMGSYFEYLTSMRLHNCKSCPTLPPLGQLPELKFLHIAGASSVVTIGPEFLGVNGGGSREESHRVSKLTIFPKLEALRIENMAKWEEWSFGKEIDEEEEVESLELIRLLPRLKQLELFNCPELRALPKGLSRCCMQTLYIKGAQKLTSVDNLPHLTTWMQVMNCGSLESVSNLSALRELIILECPSLLRVERLDSLQSLFLSDGSMKCLPEWLSTLIQQRPITTSHDGDDNFVFEFECNIDALRRCCEGCPDWPIIQQIPWVTVHELGGTARLDYTKQPFSYTTNF